MNYIALPHVSIVANNPSTSSQISRDRQFAAYLDSSVPFDRRSHLIAPSTLKINLDTLKKLPGSRAGSTIFVLTQSKKTALIKNFSLKNKDQIGADRKADL